MATLPPAPQPTSLPGRFAFAVGFGVAILAVGAFVLNVAKGLGLNETVSAFLLLVLVLAAGWVVWTTPGKIVDADEASYERWRRRVEDLGKARNPGTTAADFARLLRTYPDSADMIEAVHANPAYLQSVRDGKE
jgi:hypothetical protein